MAFGKKGSVRDTWHFIFKELSYNPDIQFEEFYNDPRTQHQIKLLLHQLGPEKCKERVWELFSEIKQQLGYVEYDEEDECECDEEETLAEQVNRLQKESDRMYALTESIIRNNINNPRYLRANSADRFGYIKENKMMIERCGREEEEENVEYNAELVENDVAIMLASLESVFEMDVNYVIDWQIRGKVAAGITFTVGNDDHIFNDYEVQELIDEVDDMVNGEIDFYANDTELEIQITYPGVY